MLAGAYTRTKRGLNVYVSVKLPNQYRHSTYQQQEEVQRKRFEMESAASMSDAQSKLLYYCAVKAVVPPKVDFTDTLHAQRFHCV